MPLPLRSAFAAILAAVLLPAAPGHAQSLDKLLVTGHWCTYSYERNGTISLGNRYTFNSGGSFTVGKDDEPDTGSSIAGMHGRAPARRDGSWEIMGNVLHLRHGDGEKEPHVVQVRRDPRGQPVLSTQRTEYFQCP